MSSRDIILSKLGSKQFKEEKPGIPPREEIDILELPKVFAKRLSEAGAACSLTENHRDSMERLADFLYREKVEQLVMTREPFFDSLHLKGYLEEKLRGLRIFYPEELSSRSEWLEMDLGLTSCSALIAATGTIVLGPENAPAKMVSLLPSRHFVLAPGGNLFQDLRAWMESLDDSQRALSHILMHGPSRTADIEKNIVLGIHGPRQVRLLFPVERLPEYQTASRYQALDN